jgi:hypothetical protein
MRPLNGRLEIHIDQREVTELGTARTADLHNEPMCHRDIHAR